ncbi:norphogenetic protein [Salmonella enterica subsp. diarizonae]|nr:norphogenetic protein [Salmonella enterica subsp. diarizonae]
MFNEVFCVASGPSLKKVDCERIEERGYPVVAVNNAYSMFRQPYALFAGDEDWWRSYGKIVPENIRRCTASRSASVLYGIEYQRFGAPEVEFNSGSMAIQFAASLGAKHIYLIGYDCSIRRGVHFHGRHTGNLRNPSQLSVKKWHREFAGVREELSHIDIINCSRRTELTCFPIKSLEAVIG